MANSHNGMKHTKLEKLKRMMTLSAFLLLIGTGTASSHGSDSQESCRGTGVVQGDGITDDAAAIQALLDSRTPVVYLPPPKKFYLIGKALRIHSNQMLRLDRTTIIRLADNANDYMLINADKQNGDINIHVTGGVWDGNNLHQTCPYHQGDRGEGGLKKYMGSVFFLMNVENLWIEGLTVKDPETFGVHLAKVRKFTVRDIVFDYNMELINEDGVHINGPSSEGLVQNLKGNTNDDMVALNSDDHPMFEPSLGAITDIRIDGLWADNGFTAVRMLSGGSGSPIKRIHVSNIFGAFRFHGIIFTYYNFHKGEPGLIEDVKIDNVHIARQIDPGLKPQPDWIMNQDKGLEDESGRYTAEELAGKPYFWWENRRKSEPFILIQDGMTMDNFIISNFSRREYLSGTRETITIEKNAVIRNLALRDIIHENKTDVPLPFIRNEGTIEYLLLDNVHIRDNSTPVTGDGKIDITKGEFTTK
jgi:hypothetical protein